MGVSNQSARKVLLLASECWLSTARLAVALESFGCDVDLMARPAHPAVRAGVIARTHAYSVLRPVESILRAIRSAQPDVVLPVDELAVLHLDELREAAEAGDHEEQRSVCALLTRSGHSAEVAALGRSRAAFIHMAAAAGVAVPETLPVPDEKSVDAAINSLGLPLALKADATFGGRGVRLVSSVAEARRSWHVLHESSSLTAAVRRGLRWGEWTYVREWAHGTTRSVSAQRLVRGHERTAMAVASAGTIKAAVCLEVLQTSANLGPSSVLRIVQDEAMLQAMQRVARATGVSGLCGFDFMIDEKTGTPLMLEMNLRPTQLAHLPLGPGQDLVAAYLREMLGMQAEDRPAATADQFIALFPKEIERDPASEWFARAHHDVPWESPGLVRAALRRLPPVITADPRWQG
jgi:biotin carboxylase